MKINETKFRCDNKHCQHIITGISASLLNRCEEHFCNLVCRFLNEGKEVNKITNSKRVPKFIKDKMVKTFTAAEVKEMLGGLREKEYKPHQQPPFENWLGMRKIGFNQAVKTYNFKIEKLIKNL